MRPLTTFRRALCTALAMLAVAVPAGAADCLYVSSYHPGYHWNDAIEAGLQETLAGRCDLHRFYMDTKRHHEPAHAEAKAREAFALIRQLRPAVVIACDDSASRYLVAPYLRERDQPVVFCGVNWTVEPYGYPYSNATGMIEVAPMGPLLREARALVDGVRAIFLSADVPTQHKEAERLAQEARRQGLHLETVLVDRFEHWQSAFERAQDTADLIVLGNPIGIEGWDPDAAQTLVGTHTRRLTLSFGVYMQRYAALTMTNVPREQGEWAGQAAALILEGESPANIPIVPNHRWEIFVRPDMARCAGIELPESLLRRAVQTTP